MGNPGILWKKRSRVTGGRSTERGSGLPFFAENCRKQIKTKNPAWSGPVQKNMKHITNYLINLMSFTLIVQSYLLYFCYIIFHDVYMNFALLFRLFLHYFKTYFYICCSGVTRENPRQRTLPTKSQTKSQKKKSGEIANRVTRMAEFRTNPSWA